MPQQFDLLKATAITQIKADLEAAVASDAQTATTQAGLSAARAAEALTSQQIALSAAIAGDPTILSALPTPVPADGTTIKLVEDFGIRFYTADDGAWVPGDWLLPPAFPTVLALLDNTAGTLGEVGQIIVAGGFSYEVAPSSATDQDVTTAGGVKFYVTGADGVYNVLAFGADPAGATDSSTAFNLASRASFTHAGNGDLSMRRDIYIPPGDFQILQTVYVRKGQRLRGAGDGATRITVGPQTSTGRVIFKLGFGKPGGVETQDPGGLPPIIENMHTFGGDTTGAVVDMQVAGAQCRDMFITSCGVGILLGGGDTITTRCIIDQGLGGIQVAGQNHIINSCLFYLMNFGINIRSNSFDVQIGDCHFEYSPFNDILFQDGATNIRNISIADCQFLKNEQFSTSDAAINIRSNGAEVNIRGCDFRNQRLYSIRRTNGIGNIVRVSDCTFNGARTNPVYHQSTSAQGIDTTNCEFEITNCRFENLHAAPIRVAHTFNYRVTVKGCTYKNITGATHFVNITGNTGSVVLSENEGDGVLPLFNAQSPIEVVARRNSRWFGPSAIASSRRFVSIPIQRGGALRVSIRANSNPGGSASYRKQSTFFVQMHTDRPSGSDPVSEFLQAVEIAAAPGNFAPKIAEQFDLDSVGSGLVLPTSGVRSIVVSVPESYTAVSFEADYLV